MRLPGSALPGREASVRRGAEAALIVAVALTLNLAGNGRVSLWDRDEPRYAESTREMRDRGDWLYPTFNAEPRYHKPILIYWLMRGGFLVAGDNPFGARLVSALAGAGTCLVVLGFSRRVLGDRAGFLAALMLTTAPLMVAESKLATTDATLALFLTGAQWCVWELSRRESAGWAAAFWTLLALAVLTKGPVGPALIACAGLASWAFGGPTECWRRLHVRWGVPLFLLIAAPWYVAIGVLSHGDFYRFAVGKQIAERVTSGMEQHGGFPGYYLVTSLVTFHPWSALLPAALAAAWARRRCEPRLGFLTGWVVGPLLLLEVVRTKLVHYNLPAYPAWAMLAAWLVTEVAREGVNLRRWPCGRLSVNLLGGVGLGLTATATAAAAVLPAEVRWPSVAIALAVGSGTLWGLFRLQRGETERAVMGLAATWGGVMLCAGGWLLPAAEPYRLTRRVGEKIGEIARRENISPVLFSFKEPTVIYAMRRPAAVVRTWAHFYEELDRSGRVVTALRAFELDEFARREDHLRVHVREVVAGFNFDKGMSETLTLAVVEPAGGGRPRAGVPMAVRINGP